MKEYFTLISIFLAIIVDQVQAQEVQKENFDRIAENYKSDDMSLSFTYHYYNDAKSLVADEVVKGQVHKKGKMFYYKLGEVEMLRNTRYSVLADHANHYIALDTIALKEEIPEIPMDSILRYYDDISWTDEAGYRTYKVNSPLPEVAYTIFKVKSTEWTIEWIEIYFYDTRQGKEGEVRNKLRITYDAFSKSCQWQTNEFSETRYITRKNSGYSPVATYKNYQFINNLE